MPLSKAEQSTLIENLTRGQAKAQVIMDELRRDNVAQAKEIDRLKSNENHLQRRLANLGGDFVQVWRDERTMRLRYQWLETAATDVVSACPEHLAGQLDELREELGIETKGD